MGKIASETAELLKEIILSCSAEDILPEELDNFIDFLANVSDSNANEPQAIDKTGAEVLFLTSFLTEELEKDFPEIETDFIFHSRAKLPQFGRDAIPLVNLLNCSSIIDNHQQRVLASILCGAQSGDSYCAELLKSMYKIYHKKEYSQFKRYPKLTSRNLADLCTLEYSSYEDMPLDTEKLARILTMAPFFHISCSSDCDIFYSDLNNEMEQYLEDTADTTHISIDPEDITNTVKHYGSVLKMLTDKQERNELSNSLKLAREIIKMSGLSPKTLGLCGDGAFNAYNMALITKTIKLTNYDSEQLQAYMMICDLARYLGVTLGFIHAQTQEYLFQTIPKEKNLKVLQSMKKKSLDTNSSNKTEKTSRQQQTPAPMESSFKSEAELSELKIRLRDALSIGSHFQEQYKEEKHSREELEKRLKEYDAMKQELTALREFVYNSAEDTPPTVNIPISEMKKAIAMKRITIVGGNENWVKKLRQEFPNWKFVSASVSSTVDNMSILKAERVILFTDTLGHSNYYKFMQTIQSHHIPFSFLHGVNIERNIIQIYDDIFEKR